MRLFRKGNIRIIAKFHRTDLVICSHSRERKPPSYSRRNTVGYGIPLPLPMVPFPVSCHFYKGRRDNFLQLHICFPGHIWKRSTSTKGSTLKRICSNRSKFFPLKVDHYLKREANIRANCVLAELNPTEKEGKHKMTELLPLKMYTLTLTYKPYIQRLR